jgi:hypothetical protein
MLNISDVYIMPSVSEPFGISPLEAMQSNPPLQTVRGKLVKKDGKLIFQTRFSPQSADIDVPIEEIFEDFENHGVDVSLDRGSRR